MLKTILLTVLLLTGMGTDEYKHYKSVPVTNPTFFSADNMGSFYVVAANVLYQYNAAGNLQYNYNDKRLGRLGYVDVSNPLRLLLYYPDFAQVVMLDNRLAVTGSVNFRDIGILQPGIICNSYNDAMWVFDQQEMKLKRIDSGLRIANESNSLGQVVAEPFAPDFMLEYNSLLFVNNPASGILVFDVYGTYYKTLPFPGLRSFQVIGDQVLFFRYSEGKPELKSYNIKTLEEKNILLPPLSPADSVIDARIAQQKLYLIKKEIIDLYSF